MDSLWKLPDEPGTVIAIGGWWLVALERYEGREGPVSWELLPGASQEVAASIERAGAKAQCVYGHEWVMAEAEQEGGYFVVSTPLHRQYGPTIRTRVAGREPSDAGGA